MLGALETTKTGPGGSRKRQGTTPTAGCRKKATRCTPKIHGDSGGFNKVSVRTRDGLGPITCRRYPLKCDALTTRPCLLLRRESVLHFFILQNSEFQVLLISRTVYNCHVHRSNSSAINAGLGVPCRPLTCAVATLAMTASATAPALSFDDVASKILDATPPTGRGVHARRPTRVGRRRHARAATAQRA